MPRLPALWTPSLLARTVAGTVFAWLLVWEPFSPPEPPAKPVFLALPLASPQAGSLSLRIDEGHGFAMQRSAQATGKFAARAEPELVSLPLPVGRVRALRIGFYSTPAVALGSLELRSEGMVTTVALSQIRARPGTTGEMKGERLLLRSTSGGPLSIDVLFPKPLLVSDGVPYRWLWASLYAIAVATLLWLLDRVAARPGFAPARLQLRNALGTLWRGACLKPPMSLGAVALLAAIVSCAPVVFGDRSFVAPGNGAPLLYFGGPTLPGAKAEPEEDPKGSDVAAMMWQNVPYSTIEHRALMVDHELPLWNRYSSGGVPLLGQGLSMLGDPLHLLPLLTGGAVWAWDVKFLAAKMLFGLGLGLAAWFLTRQLGIAMLLTLSSAWIGFFAFRFNHPAYFSVCYAPWVLLPWLAIPRAQSWRAQCGWAAALVTADFMELASGAAKEPSMLLLCLNATGLLALVLSSGGVRRVAALCWASVLFLLLSAPCWLVFLDALRHAATISDTPTARQLQPGFLLAFFDDIFSQDFAKLENHTHPSLNFLLFTGVVWCAAAWRRVLAERATLGLAIGSAAPLALAFGIVPPGWITAIPMIGNLQHVYNVFGCVLLILFSLLGAVGWADCWSTRAEAGWTRTWRVALLIGLAIVCLYLGFTQAIPQMEALQFKIDAPLHSQFFLVYAPVLVAAAALFPLALWWLGTPGTRTAGLGLAFACTIAVHFRHGMYEATKFDDYVMNPRTGADLFAQSPAIERIARRLAEPWRTYGLGYTLSPGYHALLGLEGLCGPDALTNREYRAFCQAAHLPLDLDWRLRIDEGTLPQLKPVYDSLNQRFYLREGGTAEVAGLSKVGQADLEIYQSATAWPRAFFTNDVRACESADDYVQMLLHGDGQPFAARMGGPDQRADKRTVAAARDYRLTNNTTEFTVVAPSAGLVVLTENFEEGNFRATVNGEPTEYFRVNQMHKAVAVAAGGVYRVRFEYRPRLLTPSLCLSAAGLLLAALTPLVMRPRLSRAQDLSTVQAEPSPACSF